MGRVACARRAMTSRRAPLNPRCANSSVAAARIRARPTPLSCDFRPAVRFTVLRAMTGEFTRARDPAARVDKINKRVKLIHRAVAAGWGVARPDPAVRTGGEQ